jgi:hypothetical protein
VRKRIIIGLLAVVVSGVVAFFVSQPKKGSVEWHKREYLAAMNHWMGRSLGDRVKQLSAKVFGVPGPELGRGRWSKVEFHRKALIEVGYLEERTFRLSNAVPKRVFAVVMKAAENVIPEERRGLVTIMSGGNRPTSPVAIICPRQDTAKWEELIRKADVP